MKVTVLGCGSSGGVPLIGNDWGLCDALDSRNRRTRVSILVEEGDTTILVDTSPDMRQQLLVNNVKKISAVLFTHAHADHCHGIDDLRSVNWLTQAPMDVYADVETLEQLTERFGYIFKGAPSLNNYYKPAVTPHLIQGDFQVGKLAINVMDQDHGFSRSLGFRFGNFAYSTDVKTLSEQNFKDLEGIKIWLVDCVREAPHPTHSHLEQTLAWIDRVKPEKAYLTHMNQLMDYAAIEEKCPANVRPAVDGQVIEC